MWQGTPGAGREEIPNQAGNDGNAGAEGTAQANGNVKSGQVVRLFMTRNNEDGKSPSKSFITGAVALAFLLIGYQTAVFIHRAATLKILSSSPDTVYVAVRTAGNDGPSIASGSSADSPSYPQAVRFHVPDIGPVPFIAGGQMAITAARRR